jgi:hypothetical protein
MKTAKQVNDSMDAMIARYGWAIQGVFPGDDTPGFTYTVGMAAHGLPDVIVFGLPMDIAHPFLNQVCLRMKEEGPLPLDTNLDDVANGLPTQFVAVPREEADKYMFATRRRHADYTAIQMVWPDAKGKFPWDPEFDPRFIDQQPVLRARLH